MRKVVLWLLTVATAGMFLLAGVLKLAGAQIEVDLFTAVGIGQWFRYFTGLLEVSGAIGLFIANLSPYAALLLAVVMTGAVIAHLFIVGGSPVAAIVLLVLSLTIAWLRRPQISSPRAIAA
jgi:putative oxidoreductase